MIAISLHTNDVNSLLKSQLPRETSAVYTDGTFEIAHPVPMGLARLVAVPYIRDLDLGVSLPFSQMRLSVLPTWLTASVASLVWGFFSDVIEKSVAAWLHKHGLPKDVVRVQKGSDRNGASIGLIEIRTNKLHTWLDQELQPIPLSLRVTGASFDKDSVHIIIDAIPRS